MDNVLKQTKNNVFEFGKKLMTSSVVAIIGLAPLSILAPQIAHAAADTCTWTGLGADNNWSTPGNWGDGGGAVVECDGSGIPEDGDTLVFPDSASRKTNTNDISGLDLDRINYTGSNYIVTGTAINLTGGAPSVITFDGDLNDHGIETTITASSSKSVYSGGNDNEISGNLILAFSDGDMNFGSVADADFEISGAVSGTTGNFIISPGADIRLFNTNTFNKASIAINDGAFLDCGADECTGVFDSSDTITIYGSGSLGLNAAVSLQDNITFASGAGSPGTIGAAVSSTLSGDITVNSAATIGIQNSINLTLSGDINIPGNNTLTFDGTGDPAFQRIIQNGGVVSDSSGAGNIIVDDVRLELNGTNTYSGTTTIAPGGVIQTFASAGLGDSSAGTIVQSGGALSTGGNITIAEPLTISGAGTSSWPAALNNDSLAPTYTGLITLNGDATARNTIDASSITINSRITGTGDMTYTGDTANGGFVLGGTVANDYVGNTILDAVDVRLQKTADVVAIPSDVVATAIPAHAARITVATNEQIADDAIVTVDSNASLGGLILTGGVTETVGSVEGDGTIQLGSSSDTLIVGGGNTSGTFNGDLYNATGSSIQKIGSGTWDFQGQYATGLLTYSDFTISGGTLAANPSDGDLSSSVFTVDGGTLGGVGVVGNTIVNSGSVNPGNSPGCLNVDGIFDVNAGSVLTFELAGTTACSGYDQIIATGEVGLGGATLAVNLTFASQTGDVFTIVQGSPMTGIFAGLANNATITANGRLLRVNYTSTSVTLTDVGAAPTTIDGLLGNTGQALSTTLFGLLFIGSFLGIVVLQKRRVKLYR